MQVIQSKEIWINTLHQCMTANKKKHKCTDCGGSFSSKQYLSTHIATLHKGIKPDKHKCSICDQCFLHKGHLNTHIAAVHGRNKTT